MSDGPRAGVPTPAPHRAPPAADAWERFQSGATARRLDMIRDPDLREQLRPHLGTPAVDDYLRLAEGLTGDAAHLGEEQEPDLVLVPGVMGSVLVSAGLGGVWWLDVRTRRRLDQLGLSADGERDATPGARITPVAVDASYDAFCTAALARDDFGHLTFPYDWRRPVPAAAAGLVDLVDDTYRRNGNRPVHLVAHSMGGLVVREALRQEPGLWDRVGRIVFIGTPHYGSPAIAGYLKNHFWGFDLLVLLGRHLSRATFRSLRGVLDLLPAPAGVYPGTRAAPGATAGAVDPGTHPCANFDLYDAGAYRLGLDPAEQAGLQQALDAAREFHVRLAEWHGALPQEHRDRMLVIAGVGYRTLFRLGYRPALGFLWEHMDRVTARRPGDPHRDGDGRVPLVSAQLESVGDTRYVRGEHGGLPAIPAVREAVFDWLAGRPVRLPATPAGALAETLGDDRHADGPRSVAGHPAPAHPAPGPAADDPGYLRLEPVDEAVLARYEAAAESGRLPEFVRVKVF
ncbi:lipase family alpha/beta hydrolase [Kitasatospora sp. NPDC056327]|uniref:lipase family alpha/beta hydrolase n=1 Tax=Kitasatospora sp. NPDC056327 TaxID=3345785 RepID=UPI0035E1C5C6